MTSALFSIHVCVSVCFNFPPSIICHMYAFRRKEKKKSFFRFVYTYIVNDLEVLAKLSFHVRHYGMLAYSSEKSIKFLVFNLLLSLCVCSVSSHFSFRLGFHFAFAPFYSFPFHGDIQFFFFGSCKQFVLKIMFYCEF